MIYDNFDDIQCIVIDGDDSTKYLSFTEVKDLLIIIELGKITESLDELRKALYNLDSQFGTMLKEQMESISSNISDVQDSINFFKE